MVTADGAPPWAVERLLRELSAERLLSLDEVERRLSWSPGSLMELVSGRVAVSFADFEPVLAALGKRPVEMLVRLHGMAPGDLGLSLPARDPRFEESRSALRKAMTRRSAQGRSG